MLNTRAATFVKRFYEPSVKFPTLSTNLLPLGKLKCEAGSGKPSSGRQEMAEQFASWETFVLEPKTKV